MQLISGQYSPNFLVCIAIFSSYARNLRCSFRSSNPINWTCITIPTRTSYIKIDSVSLSTWKIGGRLLTKMISRSSMNMWYICQFSLRQIYMFLVSTVIQTTDFIIIFSSFGSFKAVYCYPLICLRQVCREYFPNPIGGPEPSTGRPMNWYYYIIIEKTKLCILR